MSKSLYLWRKSEAVQAKAGSNVGHVLPGHCFWCWQEPCSKQEIMVTVIKSSSQPPPSSWCGVGLTTNQLGSQGVWFVVWRTNKSNGRRSVHQKLFDGLQDRPGSCHATPASPAATRPARLPSASGHCAAVLNSSLRLGPLATSPSVATAFLCRCPPACAPHARRCCRCYQAGATEGRHLRALHPLQRDS